MHRRFKLILIWVGAAALLVAGYFQAPVLPFRTVVSEQGPDHTLTESVLERHEKGAVAAVLADYGERHLQTESRILITPRLFFDRDLRWNYTSKAR